MIYQCPRCNIQLQTYFSKPDGNYYINYKRCPQCSQIFVEKMAVIDIEKLEESN